MYRSTPNPTIDFIASRFVREPDYLATIRARGEQLRPGMQVSPYEGYLLAWLVRMVDARNILEIGSFVGYSTLWMASALGEGGRITTLEQNAEYASITRAHVAASPHVACVEIHEGDALAWLDKSAPNHAPYDMVFIDAQKRAYPHYVNAVLPRTTPRALIVGDNALLWGALSGQDPAAASAAAKEGMMEFIAQLADATRYESIMLPTPEGLVVARRKN